MATSSNYSNIKFSTTVIEEDILQNAKIKASLMTRYGYTTDAQYNSLIASGISSIDFMIFTSATRFSINGVTYDEGELLNNKILVSGDFVRIGIRSIRSESIITDAILSYNIL